jgi:hypothetical protein
MGCSVKIAIVIVLCIQIGHTAAIDALQKKVAELEKRKGA